jgi:hypothetical protein
LIGYSLTIHTNPQFIHTPFSRNLLKINTVLNYSEIESVDKYSRSKFG